MNSKQSILLALATGAVLMTASLVVQSSTFAANDPKTRVEVPDPLAQLAAKAPCKQYRWKHVGHPAKGYNRRVCTDKKAEPKPVAEALDHEKNAKSLSASTTDTRILQRELTLSSSCMSNASRNADGVSQGADCYVSMQQSALSRALSCDLSALRSEAPFP